MAAQGRNSTLCLLGCLICVLLGAKPACGTTPQPEAIHSVPSGNKCGRNCRWFRGEPPAVRQCRLPEDCGAPPNTQAMQCVADGRCVPVCHPHWGNCNDDYRDGCEQAIVDRYYCAGDPRIGAHADPAVVLFVREPSPAGAEDQRQPLTRSLTEQLGALNACYRSALSRDPTLADASSYRLEFSDEGRVLAVERTDSVPGGPLNQCAQDALRAARISVRDGGDLRSVTVDITFDPGGPERE